MKELNRRQLLVSALSTATLVAVAGRAHAQTPPNTCKILKTPKQPEGPFYPVDDQLNQLDTDSDLIRVSDTQQIATGEVILVEGVVRDQQCTPVQGVLVEIWQACHTGKYNHPSDPNTAALDPNFQYWGKAVTDKNGVYKFRTIIPGAYPADEGWVRPPHIHFKVSKIGYFELITQMYFAHQELNDKDLILQALPKAEQKKLVVEFDEHKGNFDIILTKV